MYIVIELWPDTKNASIVQDDGFGNREFDSYDEAEQWAKDNCHDGMVVPDKPEWEV